MTDELNFLDEKNILITGGTGSVGSGIVKELSSRQKIKSIRIFSNDENELFNLSEQFSTVKNMRFLLGSIRDKERLKKAVNDVDIIIHLAALKHVPLGEYNPFELVNTNVIGTQNIIDAAIDANVDKVIFASSDKAVHPSSVLGATKLLSEKLIMTANFYKGNKRTKFSSIRFGNILKSRGSMIPSLKRQLDENGTVKLTHQDMTRFVMNMKDALHLIFKTIDIMRGGEVFVLKMKTIKIKDLLKILIKNYLHAETIDDKIILVGTRPGEKIHEHLITNDEIPRTYDLKDMYVILPTIPEIINNLQNHYEKISTKTNLKDGYSSEHNCIDIKQIEPFIEEHNDC